MASLSIGTLVATLGVNPAPFTAGLRSAGSALSSSGSSWARTATTIGAGVGLAIAGSLVKAMDVQQANAKLAAQLGLTKDESARIGKLAGGLYAQNYGESLDQVNDAIKSVITNIDGMRSASSADLQDVSKKALDLASAFDVDLNDSTKAVAQMMKTGLAKNADEAFDVITFGLQHGADKAGDLLDTFNEYSTQFRKLGLDGSTALGLIQQGLQGGARDSDLVADALKEFSIRAVDGSTTTAAGFKALGLDAQAMSERLSKGGADASAGLAEVLTKLRAIPDPVKRAQAAVELFGTQAEDLGQALYSLDLGTVSKQVDGLAGSADKMDKTLGSSAAGGIESMKREVGQLATTIGGAFLPVVGDVIHLVGDVIGPAFNTAGSFIRNHETIVKALAVAFGVLLIAINRVAIQTTVLGWVRSLMGTFAALRTSVTSAATATTTSLSSMSARTAGAMAGIGAAVAVGVGIWSKLNGAHEAAEARTRELAAATKDLTAALEEDNGVAGDNVRGVLANSDAYMKMLAAARTAGISQKDLTDAIVNGGSQLDAMRSKINAYADAHKANGLQMSDESKAGIILKLGLDDQVTAFDDAKVALQDKTKAGLEDNKVTDDGAKKVTALGEAQKRSSVQIGGVNEVLKDQVTAVDLVSGALDKIAGKSLDNAEADIKWAADKDALTESIKKNGKSFADNTEAGRTNHEALIQLARDAQDQANNSAKQGVSLDAIAKKYHDQRQAALDLATGMKIPTAQANALVTQLFGVDGKFTAQVKADGVDVAMTKIKNLKTALDNLHANPTVANVRLYINEVLGDPKSAGYSSATHDSHRASGGLLQQGWTVVGEYGPEPIYTAGGKSRVFTTSSMHGMPQSGGMTKTDVAALAQTVTTHVLAHLPNRIVLEANGRELARVANDGNLVLSRTA